MPLKSDIVGFLKMNSELRKLNFRFMTYKIYPSGYSINVADLIDRESIQIAEKFSWKTAASYFMDDNKLIVRSSFNISNDEDLSYLVHECTHALLDYQNSGLGSRFEHEALGYLAEAIWREAKGLGSLGGTSIRTVSHRIAASILSTGKYNISHSDIFDLLNAVRAEPHYAKKSDTTYISDGF